MNSRLKSIQLPQIIYAVCLVNIFGFFNMDYFRDNFTRDDIRKVDQRFDVVRPYLTAGEVIGYVADGEKGRTADEVDLLSMRRFFKAQFACTPAILVHSVEPKKLLGVFTSEQAAKELIAKYKLKIVQSWSNGVYVLSHEEPAR